MVFPHVFFQSPASVCRPYGARIIFLTYPGLTAWATFFRAYGAAVWLCSVFRNPDEQFWVRTCQPLFFFRCNCLYTSLFDNPCSFAKAFNAAFSSSF